MAVEIKSYNEWLGQLVRKILADTPINDVNVGSALFTLLEAAATNDFENSASILNVLNLFNIDAVKDGDLDDRGADLGLSRIQAIKSSGFVTVSDSSITKRSASLYPVKPAPIKGSTVIYVNDASAWAASGSLYIGRGTGSFEGPVSYTSITNFTTYFAINLASALQNDHLLSDEVVDAQGTVDRLIVAGTVVKIPANNQSPEVEYTTIRDAVIPAGEDEIADVEVIATRAGSFANAGVNTITLFNALPFPGATVTNPNAFTNGQDVEADSDFRNRIKSYAGSLARGTSAAILSAIIGLTDIDDNKQIVSAIVEEPVSSEDPSIIYIDDGTGLQPSQQGQAIDTLLKTATGNEEFLQLANFPLPRPQVVNTVDGPYAIVDGFEFKVLVDGIEEAVAFNTTQFANINVATVFEIATAINDQATTFKCRLTDNSQRLLIYPVVHDVETIQVKASETQEEESIDANSVLKFPTSERSYIRLYQNNTLLKEKQKNAFVVTTAFSTWNISSSGNVIIAVDNTPSLDRSFVSSDFDGVAFTALTLDDWVRVFNLKFAGLTAEATASGQMKISSNKSGSGSAVQVVGGTYFSRWFDGVDTESTGQNSDFQLNRQNGNVRILTDIEPNDSISAGSDDTKGFVLSSQSLSGTFNVSTDSSGRPAEMVIVADAERVQPRAVNLTTASTIVLSNQGSDIMRIMAGTASEFSDVQPLDYVYIANRGDVNGLGTGPWLDIKSCGLFRVIRKGTHLTAGTDTYIDVKNFDMVVGSYTVQDSDDIKAFYSDKYPQLWKGSFTSNPPAATLQNIVDSINARLVNVLASVSKTNFIKITSATEDGGSLAIPVSAGAAKTMFAGSTTQQEGNPSHVANLRTSRDMASFFRRSTPTGTNVWLNRYTYSDLDSPLTTSTAIGVDGFDAYQDVFTSTGAFVAANIEYEDLINMFRGNNRGLYRPLKEIISNNSVGSQFEIPTTLLDNVSGDRFNVLKMMEIGDQDNLVMILDQDETSKTIDITMSRTGRINSGSQSLSFPPTSTAFSANDSDNEPGIDFGSLTVWSKTQNGTEFKDYAVWYRARNWYMTGGAGTGNAAFLVRSKLYGPTGANYRFQIEYPSAPLQANSIDHENTPVNSLSTYYFGSGAERTISVGATNKFSVTSLGSNLWRLTNVSPPSIDFSTVVPGDIVSITAQSSFSSANRGVYRISAVSDASKYIDVYNPNGVATVVGSPEVSTLTFGATATPASNYDGKYFILYDQNGSVAFWYDVDNDGTAEPLHGAARSVEITTVVAGDTANTIAAKTAVVINADAQFIAPPPGANIVTVTDAANGNRTAPSAGTVVSLSAATSVNGIADTYETVGLAAAFKIYPLANTSVTDIVAKINEGELVNAVAVGNAALTITKATRDETYVYGGNATALSYDHDPNPANGKHSYVSLWDAENWVLSFSNSNPNFVLKRPLVLNGVAPSVYSVDTCPNPDTSDVGEFFKLVPRTIKNIQHHMTQKALTQLPIVADVSFTGGNRKIQVKSKLFGSSGAVEIVGGTSNSSSFDIIGESSIVNVSGTDYLQMKIPALPVGVSSGDVVKIDSESGTKRLSRLTSAHTMDVVKVGDGLFQYRYNATDTGINRYVTLTITDSSASYGRPAGTVWRWTFSDAGSVVSITDDNLGNVVARPADYQANGTPGASALEIEDVTAGSVSTAQQFRFTVNALPTQADYFTFSSQSGLTFAAWFGIDGNVTQPTGGTYTSVAAGRKIAVAILSSDTPNQIVTKLNTALAGNSDFDSNFGSATSGGASLDDVSAGDMLSAYGTLPAGLSAGNKVSEGGTNKIAGLPIISVNASSRYVDVANPLGSAMSATLIGAGASIQIAPTPIIKWTLKHAARSTLTQVIVSAGTATATTSGPHRLNVGSTFNILNNSALPTTPGAGVGTVVTVPAFNQFTYVTAAANGTYIGGTILNNTKAVTRYKVEKLGFNDLVKLSRVDGESPGFIDCGAAIDDVISITGDTFRTSNTGEFRVLGLTNDYLIFENSEAVDELNTITPFNNSAVKVVWTASGVSVTGAAGSFENLTLGDWVKKEEDDDTYYRQVIGFNTGLASTATAITLGGVYKGTSGDAVGVSFDQINDVEKGVPLKGYDDLSILEGDSARTNDSLVVSAIANALWFNSNNAGNFEISEIGTETTTYKVFVKVTNLLGVQQSGVAMSVDTNSLSIIESADNKFYSYKQVANIAVDTFDDSRRDIYLTPANRSYKFSQTNRTRISSVGKLNFSTDIVTGVDGYSYYTGILRKTQRTIDGFEPDAASYPPRRAIGGRIELLPPLVRKISIAVDITTEDGVNINEISNEVRTAIINYVSDRDVGEDVFLSDIIVAIKDINGILAVTFINPDPSTERISIASNEKAFITSDDISIA